MRRRRRVYWQTTNECRSVGATRCRVALPLEEEGEEKEEEGLSKADAVNEEDPEGDRATQV